ncbi:hypothetical protein EV182_001898, partial [Spiromyces aspiralis]
MSCLVERLVKYVADECAIVHNRMPYWTVNTDSNQEYSRVAVLNMVCWLDVQGVFPSVPRGRYYAVWRLCPMAAYQVLTEIDFRVKKVQNDVRETTVSSTRIPFEELSRYRGQFVDLILPDIINVDLSYENILFVCESHTNWWKYRMVFASMRLENIEYSTIFSEDKEFLASGAVMATSRPEDAYHLYRQERRPPVPRLRRLPVICEV